MKQFALAMAEIAGCTLAEQVSSLREQYSLNEPDGLKVRRIQNLIFSVAESVIKTGNLPFHHAPLRIW